MKVFYYAEKDTVDELIECGIKLSSNREIKVNGNIRRCILTYLHPADSDKFYNDNFRAVKIKAPSDKSYVAEGALYDESDLALYEDSLMPINEYKLGTYRKPECLISCTLLPDQIENFDRRRDEPILYDNSDHIYIEKAVYRVQEACPCFNDFALGKYYDMLTEKENYIKKDIGDFSVYISKEKNDMVAIKRWR